VRGPDGADELRVVHAALRGSDDGCGGGDEQREGYVWAEQ
jgi:hypothetical protein